MKKNTWKHHYVLESFMTAGKGFFEAVLTEKSVRRAIFFCALFTGVVFFLKGSLLASLITFYVWTHVIVLELVNTAIEKSTDYQVQKQFHESARKAKDFAAGAVFLSSLIAMGISLAIIVM